MYRIIYWLKNLLHRSTLYPGSSGVILCWKEHFVRTGGFDEALEVRENSQLLTSMRRYQQQGVHRVVLLWIKLVAVILGKYLYLPNRRKRFLRLESLRGNLRQQRYETVR